MTGRSIFRPVHGMLQGWNPSAHGQLGSRIDAEPYSDPPGLVLEEQDVEAPQGRTDGARYQPMVHDEETADS